MSRAQSSRNSPAQEFDRCLRTNTNLYETGTELSSFPGRVDTYFFRVEHGARHSKTLKRTYAVTERAPPTRLAPRWGKTHTLRPLAGDESGRRSSRHDGVRRTRRPWETALRARPASCAEGVPDSGVSVGTEARGGRVSVTRCAPRRHAGVKDAAVTQPRAARRVRAQRGLDSFHTAGPSTADPAHVARPMPTGSSTRGSRGGYAGSGSFPLS